MPALSGCARSTANVDVGNGFWPHHPASGFLVGVAPLDVHLFAPVHHVRNVAVLVDGAQARCATIASVCTQVLAAPVAGSLGLDHDGVEYGLKSLAVVDVGPGDDDRQRDATAVHQQVALASFFFPDPSGWVRQLLVPKVLSSSPRLRSASARQCQPSAHIRPDLISIAPRRSRTPPTPESACG